MRRFLTVVISFVLGAVSLHAQKDFVPGYLVGYDGVRTECLVQDWDRPHAPSSIVVKFHVDSLERVDSVSRYQEIGIAEKVYVMALVDIDTSPYNLAELTKNSQPEFEKRYVSLQRLNNDGALLYSYYYEKHYLYFFSMDGGVTIQPLIHKKYMVSSSVFTQNDTYKQQLLNAFGTEKIAKDNFARLTYTQDALLKLFDRQNEVKKRSYKRPETHVGIFAEAGVGFGGVKDLVASHYNFKYGAIPAGTVGLDLEMTLPYARGRWSLLLSPAFTYQEKSKTAFLGGSSTEFNNQFKTLSIDLGLSARYCVFQQEQHRLFVDFGFIPTVRVGDTKASVFSSKLNAPAVCTVILDAGLVYRYGNHFYAGLRVCSSQSYFWNYSDLMLYNPGLRMRVGCMF